MSLIFVHSEGYFKAGQTTRYTSLEFEFEADREGYHQLSAEIIAENHFPPGL